MDAATQTETFELSRQAYDTAWSSQLYAALHQVQASVDESAVQQPQPHQGQENGFPLHRTAYLDQSYGIDYSLLNELESSAEDPSLLFPMSHLERALDQESTSLNEDSSFLAYPAFYTAPSSPTPRFAFDVPSSLDVIGNPTAPSSPNWTAGTISPESFTPVPKAQAITRVPQKKTKTPRFRATKEKFESLSARFMANPWPSKSEADELALEYDMTARQVRVWFQNRRSNLKAEGVELRKPKKGTR
ncbi:hypothetical protein HDU98_007487 [Podochytrium sp. JEL0797]|nr:hypothetical protein HDU98_007487 [Podochytrium sp. JEL0797]